MTAVADVVAGAVTRPQLRRFRFWAVLGLVVVIGAVVVTVATPAPGRSLDPRSASRPGSLALARLLQARGTAVHRTTSIAGIGAGATVLVAFPDSYSAVQLRALAVGRRLVLPSSTFAVGTLAPRLIEGPIDSDDQTVSPDCGAPGAGAAGAVRFPAGTPTYQPGGGATGTECYGGRVYVSGPLTFLGPSDLLTNADLADPGVAALDLNAISADATVTDIVWLLPGADAQGQGSPSIWQLLPGWTPRATAWLIVLGVLVMLWRSHRMGPVVFEPLPVVVRAAEIVEGHGRLYRRAHARASAAATLRQATRRRLARTCGLGPGATTSEVAAAVGARTGLPPDRLYSVLDGPTPNNDTELAALARELTGLELSPGPREKIRSDDVEEARP